MDIDDDGDDGDDGDDDIQILPTENYRPPAPPPAVHVGGYPGLPMPPAVHVGGYPSWPMPPLIPIRRIEPEIPDLKAPACTPVHPPESKIPGDDYIHLHFGRKSRTNFHLRIFGNISYPIIKNMYPTVWD
jgi:hypothetical protein